MPIKMGRKPKIKRTSRNQLIPVARAYHKADHEVMKIDWDNKQIGWPARVGPWKEHYG